MVDVLLVFRPIGYMIHLVKDISLDASMVLERHESYREDLRSVPYPLHIL